MANKKNEKEPMTKRFEEEPVKFTPVNIKKLELVNKPTKRGK